ncbi:acyl-ACP--UDP-N-acetylglucosamine O-acyltransferase [Thiohalobacter sp. IOR34]|uniref:acyl-ACP--UDP-N-acetylglucosamine O-acyltransferase n=1 Tax=Thiohalobacter sp. IOR34 TaxID=3057176 RepID=UPI0025B1C73B|nr:acyl-ACP--UDP-N-acetylglucosamine O-acyltransferase [Thiohalobacter sp. IOR34]WJW76586.1 acyl-ACP--UDP-N-acetylglucosamine O-acyltransferase [Thiohalobacter sp. IOR34]
MIDARAVIDPAAELADDVEVGPFAVIGAGVKIDSGCRIGPHAVIRGPTRIGRDNRIFQFASIGEDPQDKKYAGEATELVIGNGNTIREFVTINRGTVQDAGVTRIGDDNWIMAYVHIAHDCEVGNHTIFANSASLAGHVRVEDYVILGGFTLVHQFCTLGAHCFTAFGTAIGKDVPPYVMVSGQPGRPHGLNTEGLKRRGFSAETLLALKRAYRTLYRSGLGLEDAIRRLEKQTAEEPALQPFVDFLKHQRRGIIR